MPTDKETSIIVKYKWLFSLVVSIVVLAIVTFLVFRSIAGPAPTDKQPSSSAIKDDQKKQLQEQLARDNARQVDVAALSEEISRYVIESGGVLPPVAAGSLVNPISSVILAAVNLVYYKPTDIREALRDNILAKTDAPNADTLHFIQKAACAPDFNLRSPSKYTAKAAKATITASSQQAVILYVLEKDSLVNCVSF